MRSELLRSFQAAFAWRYKSGDLCHNEYGLCETSVPLCAVRGWCRQSACALAEMSRRGELAVSNLALLPIL